jgi:hypothetical protein
MSDSDTWPNQDIGHDAYTSQKVSGNGVARHDLLLYFILAYVALRISAGLVPFMLLISAVG